MDHVDSNNYAIIALTALVSGWIGLYCWTSEIDTNYTKTQTNETSYTWFCANESCICQTMAMVNPKNLCSYSFSLISSFSSFRAALQFLWNILISFLYYEVHSAMAETNWAPCCLVISSVLWLNDFRDDVIKHPVIMTTWFVWQRHCTQFARGSSVAKVPWK